MYVRRIASTVLAMALLSPLSVQAQAVDGETPAFEENDGCWVPFSLWGEQWTRAGGKRHPSHVSFCMEIQLDVDGEGTFRGITYQPDGKISGTYTLQGRKIVFSPSRSATKRFTGKLEKWLRNSFFDDADVDAIDEMKFRKLIGRVIQDSVRGLEWISLRGKVKVEGEVGDEVGHAIWKFRSRSGLIRHVAE